jgi:hypothetical protein
MNANSPTTFKLKANTQCEQAEKNKENGVQLSQPKMQLL